MVLLFVYLFLALFISFLCSIAEAVLLSTPLPFLKVHLERGKVWARNFLGLKSNVDQSLSAILSLNTVAHTVGAAGVGAQAIKVFGEAYFGIVSAVLTILILVITEIIPKTIGANYWSSWAKFTSYLIRVMIFITYPLVILSSFLTRLISGNKEERTVSREEIAAMASIGAEEGLFTQKEYRIIQNILELKSIRARDILTPRVVVETANENMKLQDFIQSKDYHQFSRIPVYADNTENITGYVFRQTVFEKLAEGNEELRLKDIQREIFACPGSTTLFHLMDQLLQRKEHIALIVDEFGGMDGIVTMEDIIESLLGLEILDEKDRIPDMQQYARKKWEEKKRNYYSSDDSKE